MASKRRKAIKRKTFKKETSRDKLEKQVLKEIRDANARLQSLARKNKKGTWASKKLIERLDKQTIKAWSGKGRIKIPKNATTTQLIAISKAINQFMESKTSTKKGIKDVRKSTIKSLRTSLSGDIDEEEMSEEDAEFFYSMLGENDFDSIADEIGASTLWLCIEQSIEFNESENQFIQRLLDYGMSNDLDKREKAKRLYDKYVR